MIRKELVCICCPLGCMMEAAMENGECISICGNRCSRGKEYGIKECTNPTRVITSTVAVVKGRENVLSVKTDGSISKDLIFECMKVLKNIIVEAPVKSGHIVLADILNTGVDIVASKSIDKAS